MFIDLVELVQLSETREAAQAGVSKYLAKLSKPCPTPGCFNELSAEPFLCKGYHSRSYVFKLVGDDVKSTASEGYVLSTKEICDILGKANAEKEQCRECGADRRMYREAVDGVFCSGCGFFIDYESRRIGYSQEWTLSRNLKLPQALLGEKKCTVCGRNSISAKFADYYFCSNVCLEEWLSGSSKTRKR